MRYKRLVISALLLMGVMAWLGNFLSFSNERLPASIYDFTISGLDGTPVDFERYRGKNLLIVNTASRCGYTSQYEILQTLHEGYGNDVAVLGFPSNNFLWQEPGSNAEIADFCRKNYGVTFQMFQKISVRGNDQHPLFKWLSSKSGKKPSWNFCKYVVNRKGEVTAFYGPKVSPMDEAIIKHITD